MNILNPLFVALAALVVFFAVHLIVWQFESIKSRGFILIAELSCLVYAAVVSGLHFIFGVFVVEHIWVSAPFYFFFIMLYLHFYVGIDKSVSIRILGELVETENGELCLEDLQEVYPQEGMVKPRMDLMVEKKWLIEKEGSYYCDTKGEMLARIALLLKKIYSIPVTG